MSRTPEKYQSISCSYYDRLEEYATKRLHCVIIYTVDDNDQSVDGIIVDVFAKEGAEYLKLNNGIVIRLDQLISINGIPVSTVC